MTLPSWAKRVEEEYGQPISDILRDAARTAPQTGYTSADIAREWGVPVSSMQYFCRKVGAIFSRGVSARQKDAVAPLARRNGVNACRYWVDVDGQRRTLNSECERLGVRYSNVRYAMDRHGLTGEQALADALAKNPAQ